jgi:hypothetical protein
MYLRDRADGMTGNLYRSQNMSIDVQMLKAFAGSTGSVPSRRSTSSHFPMKEEGHNRSKSLTCQMIPIDTNWW